MVIIENFSINSWILTSNDDATYLVGNMCLQFQCILQGIDTRFPALIAGHLKENYLQHTTITLL